MSAKIIRMTALATVLFAAAACGTSQVVKDEQLIRELEKELGPEAAPEQPAEDSSASGE